MSRDSRGKAPAPSGELREDAARSADWAGAAPVVDEEPAPVVIGRTWLEPVYGSGKAHLFRGDNKHSECREVDDRGVSCFAPEGYPRCRKCEALA